MLRNPGQFWTGIHARGAFQDVSTESATENRQPTAQAGWWWKGAVRAHRVKRKQHGMANPIGCKAK